jgi:hypothetical protein
MFTNQLEKGSVSPDVNPRLLFILLWRTLIRAPEGW